MSWTNSVNPEAAPPELVIALSTDPAEIAEGQRRLAVAMLRQTAADLTQDDGNTVEAEAWLGADDEDMPGFIWCCHTLGLRHTIVRQTIVERPEEVAALLARLIDARHKTVLRVYPRAANSPYLEGCE